MGRWREMIATKSSRDDFKIVGCTREFNLSAYSFVSYMRVRVASKDQKLLFVISFSSLLNSAWREIPFPGIPKMKTPIPRKNPRFETTILPANRCF